MDIPRVEESNQSPKLHQKEEGPFRCSFCTKGFFTRQSLGGHQTIHRKEIKEMRLRHKDYMLARYKRCPKKAVEMPPLPTACGGQMLITDPPSKHDRLQMEPLSPNVAFWKAHKKLKREPKLHNFFDIPNHCADKTDNIFTEIYVDPPFYDEAANLDLKL